MGLETGTYISDLVSTNPISTDPKSEGDDHLRFIKSTVKATFPNVTGAVTPTHTELNYVDGVTSAIQTQIDSKGAITGQTWTGTHAFASTTSIGNVSATEISYLDGVTSAIQTQIDLKAPLASPTFTGNPAGPTASPGTNTTQFATTEFVIAEAFSTTLPSQTGNSGKFVTTNGTTASWGTELKDDLIRFVDGTDTTKKLAFELGGFTTGTTRTITVPNATFDMVGHNTTQTLTNKTIVIADNAFTLQDNADATKQLVVEASGIGTGTTKTWTAVNENATIFTPGWRYLSTVTASASTQVDIETTLDSTYDNYMLVVNDLVVSGTNVLLQVLFKIGGSYLTTATYNSSRMEDGVQTVNSAAATGYVKAALYSTGPADFTALIPNPAGTTNRKRVSFTGGVSSDVDSMASLVENTGTGALTGLRFHMNTGTITTGTFRLYGLRNS